MVRGLHLLSGLPRTVTIKGQRFVKVCRNPIGDYRCGQADAGTDAAGLAAEHH